MSVLMEFENRSAQVAYMTTQNLNPEEPLPDNSTLSFAIPRKNPVVITALWEDGEASGYQVTTSVGAVTPYLVSQDLNLVSCASNASSQVDLLIGRSSTQSRKATVTIP